MTISAGLFSYLVLVLASQPVAAPAAIGQGPVDTMVSVGGHKLHFVMHPGKVPVTVLLESGGGSDLTSWAEVPRLLAQQTGATVVAYDRAGLGGSELGPAESRPDDEIRHLRTALSHLKVPQTTILVAHSYGAMLALLNASRHPDDVAGLVLVDPMNSRFIEATGDFIFSTAPKIERPSNNREKTIVRMVATFPGLIDVVDRLEPGLRQPMMVITAGKPFWGKPDIDSAWRRSHEALAAAGQHRRLVVAEGTDHGVPEQRPDLIVTAVQSLLKRRGS
jgi:pimeloyl-ACP methyl ester carboxylesterase